MTAKLIDGKTISATIRKQIKQQVDSLWQSSKQRPGLAVILIGNDPASTVYVRNKQRACEEVGIQSRLHQLDSNTSEKTLLDLIETLNQDAEIHGILVQLPLPAQINSAIVVEKIRSDKDVDGFHPYNIGRLAIRLPTLRSCTPYGVMALLDATGEKYYGREAVVVGASNHVGRPMAMELLLAGCTVTVCHRFTENLQTHVANADILVVAVGKPGIVSGEWVKPGATVIDIGMNRVENNKLIGDVNQQGLMQRAAWVTPVPGGVGPMTVAMLLKNTLQAASTHTTA